MFEVIKYFHVTSIDQAFKQNMQVNCLHIFYVQVSWFLCCGTPLILELSKTSEVRAFKPSMIVTSELVKTINSEAVCKLG